MNKKIILLSFILLVFLCGCGKKQSDVHTDPFDHYKPLEEHKIVLCKEGRMCKAPQMVEFTTFKYDTKNPKIAKIVDDINDQIQKDYQKTIDSKIDSDECSNGNDYQYQYAVLETFHIYTDTRYVVLGLTRSEFHLCSDEPSSHKYHQADIKIFDLKEDKVISQEEFKKQLNITDEMIRKTIDDSMKEYVESKMLGSLSNPTVDYDDVVLFFDGDFGLQVSVKIKELNAYLAIPIPYEKED